VAVGEVKSQSVKNFESFCSTLLKSGPRPLPSVHPILGSENCGDNDAQLGRINVLYHGALGGKYAPRAVFFDLEPGVIDAVRASPHCELSRPGNLVNHTRAKKWAEGHYRWAELIFF
jgi:hypothetical protein